MPSYQVAVLVGGKKLIPGPRVRFARSAERSADGTVRRRFWQITITGQVAAFSGSPLNDGTFWEDSGYPPAELAETNAPELRVRNLRNKLGALSGLFEQEPLSLEIIPGDGSTSIRSVMRQAQFTYAEGQWFNVVDFTVEAEADTVWFGGTEIGLRDADQAPEESWALEQADETGRSYRLVHTVSATSRKVLAADGSTTQEGHERARDLVLAALGFESAFLVAAGFLDLAGFAPHNYTRSVQTDVAGGRVTCTETWLCIDPSVAGPSGSTAGRALEDMVVETRSDRDSGRTVVSVSITVTGLEERHPETRALVTTRYANAVLRAAGLIGDGALAGIAAAESGVNVNPKQLSKTISRNKVTGVISVSQTYDDGVSIPEGFLQYDYEVEFENAVDVFGEFVIPGRAAGPLYQPLSTVGRKAVTVSASLLVPTAYGAAEPAVPVFNPLPIALAAIGSTPSQIFLVSDRPRWNPRRGQFSRSTSYIYQ